VINPGSSAQVSLSLQICETCNRHLHEVVSKLLREFPQHCLGIGDGASELIRFKVNPGVAGADEVVVCLEPSDGLLRLVSTLGTRDFDGLIVQQSFHGSASGDTAVGQRPSSFSGWCGFWLWVFKECALITARLARKHLLLFADVAKNRMWAIAGPFELRAAAVIAYVLRIGTGIKPGKAGFGEVRALAVLHKFRFKRFVLGFKIFTRFLYVRVSVFQDHKALSEDRRAAAFVDQFFEEFKHGSNPFSDDVALLRAGERITPRHGDDALADSDPPVCLPPGFDFEGENTPETRAALRELIKSGELGRLP
jgi:hypothetical protein